jgi:hypothetical protein
MEEPRLAMSWRMAIGEIQSGFQAAITSCRFDFK